MAQPEKGFRLAQCPGCVKRLRITVTEVMYGTTVTVRCPGCETRSRVAIPVPARAEAPPAGNSKLDDLFTEILRAKGIDDLFK